ncbi:PAS domain S-box protein [Pontibacter locisalis]|uniref:histidine kinase n=1 Tax=Pontibacter locisalis TaxID=1719035 RepID=A0ABW5IQC0_9BACT
MTPEQKIRFFDEINKYSREMICIFDSKGCFTYLSDACQEVLGYESEELVGRSYLEFVVPEERTATEIAAHNTARFGSLNEFQNTYIHKEGHVVHLLWSGTWSEEDKAYISIARNVSEEILAQQRLKEKDEFYRALVEHGTDMTTLLDSERKVLYSNGSALRDFGYEPGYLVSKDVFSFLHPEDTLKATEALLKLFNGGKHVYLPELRFRTIDGTYRWIEATVSNQLHNPSVEALVVSSRDITERIESRRRIEESEQRFKSLFENHVDAAVFQDSHGIIVDVNPATLSLLGMQKQEIINKSFSEFLPAEAASVCEQSIKEALGGSAIRFQIAIPSSDSGEYYFDVIKIPVKVSGETIGVHSILRNMTDAHSYRKTIEKQSVELNSILESITDAFFALDREWRFTYVNTVFADHEGYKKEEMIGRCIWELFPKLTSSKFREECSVTAATGSASHFEESYAHSGVTYQFSIYPSAEGVSVYFTDITEKLNTRVELEKLSLVASKTTNGVVIMDTDRKIEWVNEGFTSLTGYTLKEAVGKKPIDLLQHEQTNNAVLVSARDQMHHGKSVVYEVLNRRKNGDDLWLSVEVNPVFGANGDILRFVTIQTDITALKKSEIELKKLSLVASKTNNSVFIADKDWKIEWINDGFIKLMGYTMQEVIGKRPSELLHNNKTDRAAFEALQENLLTGEPISFDVINVKKNGEEVWVNINITAVFDEQGELTRFIEVQTDISALKEKERELTNSAIDLYRHNKDLEQFTYIVSHNLRAPVANVLGLSNLLTKVDKESVLYDKTLANLTESVNRLDTVLRDINTILSIRDSRLALEQEQVNVKTTLQQTIQSLQDQLQKCGGNILVDFEDDIHIKANRAYLYSIFYNLMSNAIKYRSEERVLQVHISCDRSPEGNTVITFSDNGLGMDLQKIGSNIFKLYKRFHTDKKGRGIGLYLVKSHVEAMDGQIEVDSTVNKGTKFTIILN